MATVLSAIEHVRGTLLAGTREQLNTLNGSHNASTTTFTFNLEMRGIGEGVVLGVDTELVYVTSVPTSTTATVIRAYGGSTAASHATAAEVIVNPKWSRYQIFNALNDSIGVLSGEGLWAFTPVDHTWNPAITSYNLTSATAVEDVYEVRWRTRGSTKEWVRVPQDQWHLDRHASTSDFASGFAVQIDNGDVIPSGTSLRIIYKAPFTRFDETSDDLTTTCGLPATCVPLLEIDSAISLVYPREVARNTFEDQGDTRRAEEVGPGAVLQSAQGWERRRVRLLRNAIRQQQTRYPYRRY